MAKIWVIHRCQHGSVQFWAWCRPDPDAPGYEDIFYTQPDGRTAHDPGVGPNGELPALGEALAVIPFPDTFELSEAQFGETFPEGRRPARAGSGLANEAVAPTSSPIPVVGQGGMNRDDIQAHFDDARTPPIPGHEGPEDAERAERQQARGDR